MPTVEPMAHSRTVFVTVGTDHHPFNRLVDWADDWARRHPADRVMIQYGTSNPPVIAEGVSAIPYASMIDHMRTADVVVTQGGPAGIMDSRSCGRRPIVVPRDPAAHEHVDDHQIRFAAHMRRQGLVAVATDEHEFNAKVEQALSTPDEFAVTGGTSTTSRATAQVVEQAVSQLLTMRRRRPRRRARRP